jgi:outer membrane protein TolC
VRRACQFVLLGIATLLVPIGARAQGISFYTVVDLALRNSTQVRISAADVQRAEAAVMESVDAYRPAISVGSSLGYSYGFPVGQPSVYSVAAQSLAYSFSQPDYIRAARASLVSAQMQLKDTRQQVILDSALDYIELATLNQQMSALDEETGFVRKLVEIETERVDAGLDSKVELTEARLTGAQIALRRLHLVDQAELVRARLAHLTGLKPADIVSESQTIPNAPEISGPFGIDDNSGVKAAYATARSKLYVARGDSRQNNRPTFGFGLEYNRYSKFNNYNEYYLRFQHNNFNVGIQITLPLFDASRTAKAKGTSAEAAHASAQADQSRNQTDEQVLQLQKNIAELTAQELVAELQNELSQDQLDAITTQLQAGSPAPGGSAVLPKDEQGAHIRERTHFVDMLETRFELTQARLTLLRTVGRIEDWAKAIPAPHP